MDPFKVVYRGSEVTKFLLYIYSTEGGGVTHLQVSHGLQSLHLLLHERGVPRRLEVAGAACWVGSCLASVSWCSLVHLLGTFRSQLHQEYVYIDVVGFPQSVGWYSCMSLLVMPYSILTKIITQCKTSSGSNITVIQLFVKTLLLKSDVPRPLKSKEVAYWFVSPVPWL